jgi:hypothetical protein
MKWVTREHPKTDRIACPWPITNFIDDDAEFLYVPADQVLVHSRTGGGLLDTALPSGSQGVHSMSRSSGEGAHTLAVPKTHTGRGGCCTPPRRWRACLVRATPDRARHLR